MIEINARKAAEAIRQDICKLWEVDPFDPFRSAHMVGRSWHRLEEPLKWIHAGYKHGWMLELARGVRNYRSAPPNELTYFSKVFKTKHGDEVPNPAGRQKSDEGKIGAVMAFYLTGRWRLDGPEPCRPGCQIAPEIVAEARARYEAKFRTRRTA